MTLQADQLREAALSLPLEQRLELADALYLSLGEPPDMALHPAFVAELHRRSLEMDTGQVATYSHEEVMQSADEWLRDR